MTAIASSSPGIDFTFTGESHTTLGFPMADEPALVRYVYHFEGVAVPHEGRATVYTDMNGFFSLTRDITNTWGDGEMLYVEAWAFIRDQEKYIAEAYPSVENFIGGFIFQHPKPEEFDELPDQPFVTIAAEPTVGPDMVSWGRIKVLFR